MVKKLYVKAICGFREDQEYSIPIDEAHKLYKLFIDGDGVALFESGLALRANDIRRIVPDFHKTMGWNKTHKLDEYDMAEIEQNKLEERINKAMKFALQTAKKSIENPELLKIKLQEIKAEEQKLLG